MNEEARAIYMYIICSRYRPEHLVSVNETSCDRRISREYGCITKGRFFTKKAGSPYDLSITLRTFFVKRVKYLPSQRVIYFQNLAGVRVIPLTPAHSHGPSLLGKGFSD